MCIKKYNKMLKYGLNTSKLYLSTLISLIVFFKYSEFTSQKYGAKKTRHIFILYSPGCNKFNNVCYDELELK